MKKRSEFSEKVIGLIKKIPRGKVATYAQIARLAGNPQGVRGVVWILHSSSKIENLPWFRVINSKGRISFPYMSSEWFQQKNFLEKEGIKFGEGEILNLSIYQWKK